MIQLLYKFQTLYYGIFETMFFSIAIQIFCGTFLILRVKITFVRTYDTLVGYFQSLQKK